MLQLYHYTCALCFGRASAMHEIVPRSKKPDNLFDLENRVPLCETCHDLVHTKGTRKMEERLKSSRASLAALFYVDKVTVTLELGKSDHKLAS